MWFQTEAELGSRSSVWCSMLCCCRCHMATQSETDSTKGHWWWCENVTAIRNTLQLQLQQRLSIADGQSCVSYKNTSAPSCKDTWFSLKTNLNTVVLSFSPPTTSCPREGCTQKFMDCMKTNKNSVCPVVSAARTYSWAQPAVSVCFCDGETGCDTEDTLQHYFGNCCFL